MVKVKFKELKSRVATLSLGTENNYRLEHYAGQTVIVHSLALYQINENIVGIFREANDIETIPERDRLALQKLAYKYSRTPIDERRDEPKFRVRMLPGEFNYDTYLNQDKRNKNISLNEPDEAEGFQTIFTKSEYDKLQQEYSEWLPKFDKNDAHFEFLEEDK